MPFTYTLQITWYWRSLARNFTTSPQVTQLTELPASTARTTARLVQRGAFGRAAACFERAAVRGVLRPAGAFAPAARVAVVGAMPYPSAASRPP